MHSELRGSRAQRTAPTATHVSETTPTNTMSARFPPCVPKYNFVDFETACTTPNTTSTPESTGRDER
jgi:hypothetical protein